MPTEELELEEFELELKYDCELKELELLEFELLLKIELLLEDEEELEEELLLKLDEELEELLFDWLELLGQLSKKNPALPYPIPICHWLPELTGSELTLE